MRKLLSSLVCLSAFSLGLGPVSADDDINISSQNFGSELMQSASQEDDYPFRISAHGDYMQRSKIDKKYYYRQYVEFYNVTVEAEAVLYYDKCHKEGIEGGVGYTNTRFEWKHNPFFRENKLDQVSFSVAGFSGRLNDWTWHTQLTANWEPKYSNFWDYTNYDIILWGKYEYLQNVNLHFGVYALTGMKIDKIFPIIGFDWVINDKWHLNVVFPMNISITYKYDCTWSASLGSRFWNIRYRYGKDERLSRGLLYYRNQGAEFAINYEKGHFEANVHAGATFGGQFRISDHKNEDKKHFDMNSAAYVGAEALVKF